ncbi:MAG: EscU/YscU/HrcU family type III secretion system export apparatus switch protein [Deltaproteobacteria bacterium]|nr:EscU/YscU/HrcU family type III secretion system export apparatus switch protein [Deltaproteobacteria bacterium]
MPKEPDVAVALEWNESTMTAPQVIAKGERLVAERIVAVAREAGVPVMRNVDLVSALNGLEVGEEIPTEMYEAVAEILRLVAEVAGEEEKGERR